MDTKVTRKFTGKLSGFETKQERNFYKKALRKYRTGADVFTWGYNPSTGEPMKFEVPQKLERLQ